MEAEPGELLTSIKHPLVRSARLLNQPAEREARNRYLIEGEDLLRIGVHCGAPILYVLLADAPFPSDLASELSSAGIPWYRLSRGLLFKIIGTPYETGVNSAAVVDRRLVRPGDISSGPDTLLLVGERIQDPRNVGVLIRTADAAGAGAAVFDRQTADPFSRAAVRSTTGSILRLPVCIAADLPRVLLELRERGIQIVSTSARAPTLLWAYDFTKPTAVVFGNETEGVSDAVKAIADAHVRIPIVGGASSLNVGVAAGIVLYEAVRQRQLPPTVVGARW
ncbi:MAG: TrmH family RNA methyltransferase [Armatimonadota bacterium]